MKNGMQHGHKKAYGICSKADEKTHKKILTPGLTAQKQMATCHVVSVTFDHDVFRVTVNIRIEKNTDCFDGRSRSIQTL